MSSFIIQHHFYQFEKFITTSIKGYIREIEDATVKMGEPAMHMIVKNADKAFVIKNKYRPMKVGKTAFNEKAISERYYAEQQLNELQKALEVNNPAFDVEK